MRELYACQLDLRETPGAKGVLELAQEWVSRGSGLDLELVRGLGPTATVSGLGHELYDALEPTLRTDEREWTCSWRRQDESDSGLRWRILLASGPSPADPELTRFALRIRLERDGDRLLLAPLRHSFNSPALVRTLLKAHEAFDSHERLLPTYAERRAADISALVARLEDPARQLPVCVVTRSPSSDHSVDAAALARSVAGLAHVDVLSTHLAAMALTDELGREASVWGGGVRMYWPHFTRGDDPFRHRLWVRSRVEAIRDFPGMLLTSLGSLAAARVPEHPVVAKARGRRRPGAAEQDKLPEWAEEWVQSLETSEAEAGAEADAARAALADALQVNASLEAELAGVREAFRQVHGTDAEVDLADAAVDLDAISLEDAFKLAVAESSSHVAYLPSAASSVEAFDGYKSPRRLYEALTAISDAAEAWHQGTLGIGFGQFFADRGYEFSKNNPSALAKKTKSHYQRQYNGDSVLMEPHLKVDQSTTPDQCLRVYWYRDDTARRLVIGHVGRHLPD
jgi:hypothetical protein